MHSVLLVFFAFRSLVFMLLLFLTMNPHYMTSYNLVFYCSIKKKKRKQFFAIMPVRACVFASCVIAINYACAVQSLMSTLDQWVCVMSGRLVYSDWQWRRTMHETRVRAYVRTGTSHAGFAGSNFLFSSRLRRRRSVLYVWDWVCSERTEAYKQLTIKWQSCFIIERGQMSNQTPSGQRSCTLASSPSPRRIRSSLYLQLYNYLQHPFCDDSPQR